MQIVLDVLCLPHKVFRRYYGDIKALSRRFFFLKALHMLLASSFLDVCVVICLSGARELKLMLVAREVVEPE